MLLLVAKKNRSLLLISFCNHH